MSNRNSVFVEAPARLHFGVLDLAGRLGRHFGGLGAAIPCPSLLLEASPSAPLVASGPDSARVLEFAKMFLSFHQLPESGRFVIHRAIPSHAGLGSGTQLGLAVARALAELHGIEANALELAAAVARGKRSAIGTWAFALGGFIVEGGRKVDSDDIAPLLARYEVPSTWRCVVAVPQGPRGLSGEAEISAFERLPAATRPRCRAGLSSGADAASSGLGGGGSAELRRCPLGGAADYRRVVRWPTRRDLRARPYPAAGQRNGRVGCGRCGAKLLGTSGLRLGFERRGSNVVGSAGAPSAGGQRGRFRGGIRPGGSPGQEGTRLIDSSFFKVYTDPPSLPYRPCHRINKGLALSGVDPLHIEEELESSLAVTSRWRAAAPGADHY